MVARTLRADRDVESLTAQTADPSVAAELAEATLRASRSLQLLLGRTEDQLFVSAVSGDSSEASSVLGKLDEDVGEGKEQRGGHVPAQQQQVPWDGVQRAVEWVYGAYCQGLNWVEEAGRALRGEQEAEAMGATLSKGDLEHLRDNPADMQQVLETVRAWQWEDEERVASPANQLARMQQQMDEKLEAQRQVFQQQLMQSQEQHQLQMQQQMLQMQQTFMMVMKASAGGGGGGGMDVSGTLRSPQKGATDGAAGGSAGVEEAAPSVVGSRLYCLSTLLDPEKGGFLGDPDGMTEVQLAAL